MSVNGNGDRVGKYSGQGFRMKRVLYLLANTLAGIVLILVLLDPTRNLGPVFVLLALAVACNLLPWFLRRRPGS